MDSERLLDTEYTHNIKKVEEAGFRFCPPWGGAINSAVCMSVATQQRGADNERGARSLLQFFTPCLPSRQRCLPALWEPGVRHVSSRRNATHLRRRCAPRHISIDPAGCEEAKSGRQAAALGQLECNKQRAVSEACAIFSGPENFSSRLHLASSPAP